MNSSYIDVPQIDSWSKDSVSFISYGSLRRGCSLGLSSFVTGLIQTLDSDNFVAVIGSQEHIPTYPHSWSSCLMPASPGYLDISCR